MTSIRTKTGTRAATRAVEDIRAALAANRPVRKELPFGGRIHIDRLQPFLCVYRTPRARDDAGTSELLTGQASYLLLPGAAACQAAASRLVRALVTTLSEAFGAVVLLEVWTSDKDWGASDWDPAPETRLGFRILAPKSDPPHETLDALKHGLSAADWGPDHPDIGIEYGRRVAPPGLPVLLGAKEARALGCARLGLELRPGYQDPDTGQVLPAAVKRVRHELGRVLKQAFYAFSHARASYRPAHYHALGQRAITRAVWDADKRLAKIGDAFDLLLQATPVNTDAAWSEFRRRKFSIAPRFRYRPWPQDPAALKRELYKIPLERIEDPTLHHLFEEKRNDLDRRLTMVSDVGTPKFLYGGLQVYGPIEDSLAAQAEDILVRIPPHTHDDIRSDHVNAAGIAKAARAEIAHYRKRCPQLASQVEVRDDVPGLIVSEGRLLVGRSATVPRSRLGAILQHEIGTHIVTYANGLQQPFQQLHTGMAGYDELQEGMAVLSEYLVGGLSRPRLRTLGGRVVAARSVVRGADFIETFRLLCTEWAFSQRTAYQIAMRVHRGGGLVKDAIYLRGLVKLLDYLAHGGAFETLFVGKVALGYVDFVEELLWRGILKPGLLRPRYLDNPEAGDKIKNLGRGVSLADLIEQVRS